MERKTKYLIIGLCCIFGLALGSTVAWYTWTSSESTDVTFTIGGITINYVAGDDITGRNLRPTISKEVGVTNNYAIKKDITVSSNKTSYLNLYLTAEILPVILSHGSLKWEVYEGSTLLNDGDFKDVQEGNKITLLKETEINSTTRNISLYIWIDGNMENPSEMSNQDYYFVLTADASDQTPPALVTLTNLGLTEYLNKGKPNFANVATTDEGIYQTEDDLGTTYYFRGASEYNYVIFNHEYENTYAGAIDSFYETLEECEENALQCSCSGENNDGSCYLYLGWQLQDSNTYTSYDECYGSGYEYFACIILDKKITSTAEKDTYWRIIRINGDGTIRLIYDGENVHRNGAIEDDLLNGETLYAAGYDNGSFYADNSIITKTDDWYVDNITSTPYVSFITDSIFCNDGEFVETKTEYRTPENQRVYKYYDALSRISTNNPKPSLKCLNGSYRGDGIIMADEVIFAGGAYQKVNKSYYLYTGSAFHTGNLAYEIDDYNWYDGEWVYNYWSGYPYVVEYSGMIDYGYYENHTSFYDIRPVISLKADTEFTGTGTWDDPFVIKMS